MAMRKEKTSEQQKAEERKASPIIIGVIIFMIALFIFMAWLKRFI